MSRNLVWWNLELTSTAGERLHRHNLDADRPIETENPRTDRKFRQNRATCSCLLPRSDLLVPRSVVDFLGLVAAITTP